MTFNYSEKEMVLGFCKLLEEQNIDFAVEVPFFNRSIDLVYINQNKEIYAFEFKINDWRHAIRQAKDYALGAHYVYVCLPKQKFSKTIEKEIWESNLGLILFDLEDGTTSVVKNGHNPNFWSGTVSALLNGFQFSVENRNYQQLLA